MPIGIALGAGALAASTLYPALNPIIIPSRFVGLLSDSFIILSAPLFILAGNLAARGGVARAIIDLATVLVGRFRGGLAGWFTPTEAAAVAVVYALVVPLLVYRELAWRDLPGGCRRRCSSCRASSASSSRARGERAPGPPGVEGPDFRRQ